MSRDGWPPLGFLLLMLGFGLRLDTPWETIAWLLLAVGAGIAVAGLVGRGGAANATSAFVPPRAAR